MESQHLINMKSAATAIVELAQKAKILSEQMCEGMKAFKGKLIVNQDGHYNKRFTDMFNELEFKKQNKQNRIFVSCLSSRRYYGSHLGERREVIIECRQDYKIYKVIGDRILDLEHSYHSSYRDLNVCVGTMENGILQQISLPDIKIPEWANDIEKHCRDAQDNIDKYNIRKAEVEKELKELEMNIPYYFKF